ncbi:MAG: hypothetical protein M3347_10760, partial [Armatimonadota bacterium]|nr:hypothetical protein [Armatimonadota bacterium]
LIAMVLTGKRALADELRNDVSPLRLLITQQYELQPFSPSETRTLVDKAHAHGWQVEDGCAEIAYEITKGHPYRLHYHLYNALSKEGKLSVTQLKMLCADPSAAQHLERVLLGMPHDIPNSQELTQSGVPHRVSHTEENLKGQIDFGIITVREDEHRAILKRFPVQFLYEGAERSYGINLTRLTNGTLYTTAIIRCIERGTGQGQDVARDLISDLNPHWIMLAGISCGVPEYEWTLGDVILASRLQDFSVHALLDAGRTEFAQAGGPMHRSIQDFLAALPMMEAYLEGWNSPDNISILPPDVSLDDELFYGDEEWKGKVKKSLAAHFRDTQTPRNPRYQVGVTASSDALVKDSAVVQQWRQNSRQLLNIEMELAGVYTASRRTGREYPILAVRGISDIIGYDRHPDWTAYACQSAASFARSVLELRPFHPVDKTSKLLLA